MNEIQRDIPEKKYTRNIHEVNGMFSESGVRLHEIISKRLEECQYSLEKPFTVVDLGCGSGTAIEQFAQKLMWNGKLDGDYFRTVGIDSSLVTPLIPEKVLQCSRDKEIAYRLRPSGFLTDFIEHDLEQGIPLETDSVDVLYAAELMNYIVDSLKLLEESYRCLKPGGIAVIRTAPWMLAEPENPKNYGNVLSFVAGYRHFMNIAVQNVLRASEIFKITYDEHFCGGIIVMKKVPEAPSIAFGCHVHKVVKGKDLFPGRNAEIDGTIKHSRSAIYRTMNGNVIPIVKEKPNIPLNYIVSCPL